MSKDKNYIYAFRYQRLSNLYDPFVRLTTRGNLIKEEIIKQANVRNGLKILDAGCGTGTLLIMIKKMYPDADVYGVDGDPSVLKIANEKAKAENVHINLAQGMIYSLPHSGYYFDRVFSTLAFHHLTTEHKISTLKEIYRILKPKGEAHIADFGKPANLLMRVMFHIARTFENPDTTSDNLKGKIPEYMKLVKFNEVEEVRKLNTIVGTIRFYKGLKT